MTHIENIRTSLRESREGLEDFGRVTRDYTFMKAFINENDFNSLYERYVKGIINELQAGEATGADDPEQTLEELSENRDSGIDTPEES